MRGSCRLNIYIDGTLTYEQINQYERFDALWGKIQADLLKQHRVIDRIMVDGKQISHVEQHVKQHVATIRELIIVTISEQEFLGHIIAEIKRLNDLIVLESDQLASIFYGTIGEKEWGRLIAYIQGIESQFALIETGSRIIRNLHLSESDHVMNRLHATGTELAAKVNMLEEPLANQNTSLIADLITYELMPIFQRVAQLLNVEQ